MNYFSVKNIIIYNSIYKEHQEQQGQQEQKKIRPQWTAIHHGLE